MEPQALDTLWLLICAGLVFLMQPGFLCLESGLSRSKSAVNVALKNLADFGLSVVLFWAFGYSLIFGATAAGWLGRGSLFPAVGGFGAWAAAFFVFHAMFCGTAVTIVSGAVAERLRFRGYLLITLLASGPIYTMLAHWAWNGLDAGSFSGWLGAIGFRDFAGATVVHGAGGWLALAAVLVLGPRRDRFPDGGPPKEIPGHNLPVALLGGFLLWLGWFGFNGGSALGWSDRVPAIVANTMLAGAGGLAAALFAGSRLRGRPDVKLALNGTLAGLVSITGACQAVGSAAAIAIGTGGGLVMIAATWLLERQRIDDVVGAVPVHAAAGAWGTLAVAIFGDLRLLGTGLDRGEQLGAQALGAVTCFLWAFGGGYLALRLIDRVAGLRVSPQEEDLGLDLAEYGATSELLELTTAMERQAKSGNLELQQAMEEVRVTAERYRRTIDNALDAIVTIDDRGVIVGWNRRAETIFGWAREDAIGKDVFALVTRPKDRETTRAGLLSYLTTGGESTLLGQRIEVTGVDRDGHQLPIEATFTMATVGDRPEFNIFFQDITERRRARRALQRAKEAAEAATRTKSEFLANMSHEIRTPMNGILGIVELMLDAEPSHRQRRYLEMIRASADSLLRLLADVLNYSKFEAGKIDIQAVDFALRRHLADLLGTLAIQARKKGLSLKCRVEPEVPEPLVGDPIRLGQVVLNLVANAIKFTPEGEVTVEVRLMSRDEAQAVLELIVTDTGPGIPADKREAIFQPFEQAGATAAQRHAGAGLGLAICKSLVESMGGRIGVDGAPSPRGSTFRFECPFGLSSPTVAPDTDTGVPPRELPLLDADFDFDNLDEAEASPGAVARRGPELGPGRVLVVEDNRINQVVAEGMLESWGLDTEIASSGREALAAFEQRSFDLVLTDMRMPDLDGFAVTAAIREAERRAAPASGSGAVPARVPIIATTANVSPGDRQRCLDAGMDGYVAKPIHKPALLAVVCDALAPAAIGARAAPREGMVFDRETLLRRVGGRHERARKLAAIFLEEDGPTHRSALGRAFAEDDPAAVRDAAHALRGAAGEICAAAVATAAEQLEIAARDQDLGRLEKKYETLEEQIERLTSNLEVFLKEQARASGDTHEGQ